MLSASPSPSDTSPLENLLVVSIEQAVAAPLCTVKLADDGARVIKVERPEGDFARSYDSVVNGESAYFLWLNRGKESITLNIKQPSDSALLHRMISRADIFVQNLSPRSVKRLGLTSNELRAANSRLITCDITGYGDCGPYRDRKAYDLLIQCESALASVTGGPSEAGRVGVSVADICCGMNAYAGILRALIERARTGQGSGVKVSLFDGLAEWMTVPLLHQEHTGKAPKRLGLHHPTIAPYGAYSTGDGKRLIVAVQNEREWRSFCVVVLGREEIAEDPRFLTNSKRCANRAALDAAVHHLIRDMTVKEFAARLERGDIAFSALNTVEDLARHPQLRRITIKTPSGTVQVPAPPVIQNGRIHAARSVPALGADSGRLRREFT
jgi:crotonobetainyl-CoA:carnitine CoA-transferase CaiB-like acyl-CoA transferase